MYFWAYRINGTPEDSGNKMLYIVHANCSENKNRGLAKQSLNFSSKSILKL